MCQYKKFYNRATDQHDPIETIESAAVRGLIFARTHVVKKSGLSGWLLWSHKISQFKLINTHF